MKNSIFTNFTKGTILNSGARLEKIARKTRWLIRKPVKLTPFNFVRGMLLAVSQGECSIRLVASAIGLGLEVKQAESEFDTISKNGLWKRVNGSAVAFLKTTLDELIKETKVITAQIPALPSIGRIIVEDSAILNLADNLLDDFAATNNQHGAAGAGLRLQFALDLISGKTLRADLTRYGRNDQKAAYDIIELLQEGDLVIRDLGYFVIGAFLGIVAKGAHFLSRHNTARTLFHTKEKGGKKIDLLAYLQKHAPECGDMIDRDIVMGSGTKRSPRMESRLVARRVPQQVEEKRLRRIKQDEKRLGKQRTKTHKKLQGWEVYITSLPREEVPAKKICDLYPLRWRVEIIFKACKSYTPVKALATHRSHANHVQCLLYAWLCLLVLATQTTAFAMAKPSTPGGGALKANLISLLKVVPKVFQLLNAALYLSSAPLTELTDRWLCQIDYHDRYEKRRKRTNMAQLLEAALDLETGADNGYLSA